jgi:hypothetical protein
MSNNLAPAVQARCDHKGVLSPILNICSNKKDHYWQPYSMYDCAKLNVVFKSIKK